MMKLLDSKEALFTFSLIYASHEDLEYSETERSFIKDRFGEDLLREQEALYFSMSNFAALTLIQKSKENLLITPDEKLKFTTLLKTLFSEDGRFSKLEKTLLTFLSRY